jgi:hypothetical protein
MFEAAHSVDRRIEVAGLEAVDASGSIANDRLLLQLEGHARAIESERFVAAVEGGLLGRSAVTFFAWTGWDRQSLAVRWTGIDNAESAHAFARTLRRATMPIPGYTSISGAIDYGVSLLNSSGFDATHRVIDICGNGINNDGRLVTEARDDAVAQGITINGLAILDAMPRLDLYFDEHVIGGSRAFVTIARDVDSFATSVLRKLVQEVSAVRANAHA